ncbi:MAG: hypothetical protein JWM04_2837, partial [Verrucomicrobiales bacterium]|nr:hypothetical protein [Verrucomicrobiales bacterium]
MMKTRLTIISCVILSIALCALIEIRNGIETRKRTEILRHAREEAERLTRENERLHRLIAQVQSSNSLSREQLLELLNLRNEVGTLRQSEPLKEKLKETNKLLRAAITKKEKELEEARSLPNYWPKERLVYSGFTDPESAIKSILAAMITGNMS